MSKLPCVLTAGSHSACVAQRLAATVAAAAAHDCVWRASSPSGSKGHVSVLFTATLWQCACCGVRFGCGDVDWLQHAAGHGCCCACVCVCERPVWARVLTVVVACLARQHYRWVFCVAVAVLVWFRVATGVCCAGSSLGCRQEPAVFRLIKYYLTPSSLST